MQPIYLDRNSTAPLLPEVAHAMADAHAAGYANPASQHAAGRRAHQVLEETREEIARLLGADPSDQLLFTSGGTEANNLALFGLTDAYSPNTPAASSSPPSNTPASPPPPKHCSATAGKSTNSPSTPTASSVSTTSTNSYPLNHCRSSSA